MILLQRHLKHLSYFSDNERTSCNKKTMTMVNLVKCASFRLPTKTSLINKGVKTIYMIFVILDLQPISRELLDNVARPLRLMPTIELIKYSFVPHHQHDRCASQE